MRKIQNLYLSSISTPKVFSGLVVALVLIAGIWLFKTANIVQSTGESVGVKNVVPIMARDSNSQKLISRASNQRAALQDLPNEKLPLAVAFSTLANLSDEGDARASMRLFSDLSICQKRDAETASLNYFSYSPKDENATIKQRRMEGLDQLTVITQKNLEQLQSSDRFCKGVAAAQVDQRGEFLRRAALQGDTEAMVCYAASTLYVGPKYLSDNWFSYAERWTDDAPYFAQKAFEAGQADVIPLLIDAFSPDDPSALKAYQLSEVVTPNQGTAYALALLYARLVPESDIQEAQSQIEKLSRGLTSAEISSARSESDAIWPKFAHAAGETENMRPCSRFVGPM